MSKQNARSIFKNAINDRTDTVAKARKETGLLKTNRVELVHVADRIFYLLGTNQYDMDQPRVGMHISVNCVTEKPFLYVSYRGATGFKDDDLMIVMSYLMGIGFEDKGKGYEYAEALNREYEFARADMIVRLDVYVRSDSPTCRKVVVGEETKTYKTYKIECD